MNIFDIPEIKKLILFQPVREQYQKNVNIGLEKLEAICKWALERPIPELGYEELRKMITRLQVVEEDFEQNHDLQAHLESTIQRVREAIAWQDWYRLETRSQSIIELYSLADEGWEKEM